MFNFFRNNFVVENGPCGREIVMTGPWHKDIVLYTRKNDIKSLLLNDARGWKGDNVSFLSKLPFLECFRILDWNIKDVSTINTLKNLKLLEVSTYCKTVIDFKNFLHLEDCGFEWRTGSESLFSVASLKKLFLNNYDQGDTSAFSALSNLESLSIASSPTHNLHGLSSLAKLKFLGLYALKKLTSLDEIEKCVKLEKLEIGMCKYFHSIEAIGDLQKLQYLEIIDCGNIDSIRPLSKLKHLNKFFFFGTTNIVDGDLKPLQKFNLAYPATISFQNRKHYTRKRENFK